MSDEISSDGEIVGEHPSLMEVLGRALRVARTRTPVLVSGESGTGKELVARLVHSGSARAQGPLVAVNCGALPRELAESELFGFERGAFTGAKERRRGWFEQAQGGTLVLDEVGELPLELQPKLLRVLDSGRLRRLGSSGEVAVDVRIVAVTLRDLRRETERGRFRLDLYHRLAAFELSLPPLRTRRSDIALLARHFLRQLESELGPRTIADDALAALDRHDWPGNVRELRNVLRRAAVMSPLHIDAGALELPAASYAAATAIDEPPPAGHLADREDPDAGARQRPHHRDDCGTAGPAAGVGSTPDVLRLGGQTFEQIERAVFGWALRRNGGSRRRAAQALAVPRSTFCDKVRRYRLCEPDGRLAPGGDPW